MFGTWGQFGRFGLILASAAVVIPWWVRREVSNEPMGGKHDPLPPNFQTPPEALFVYPEETPLDQAAAARAWQRRWKAHTDEPLSLGGLSVLMGHTLLATKGRVSGHNIVRLTADRFDVRPWTTVRVPEWKGTRPVYRWLPVRSYLSYDESAYDWLRELDGLPGALDAVRSGDPVAYARTLNDAASTPAAGWAPELVALARRWGKKARETAA